MLRACFRSILESPDLFYFQMTQLGRSLLWRLLRISWSIQRISGDEPVGPVFSEIPEHFRSDAIRNHSKGLLRLSYTDRPHRDCHIFASIQNQLIQLLVHIVECGSAVTSEEGEFLARECKLYFTSGAGAVRQHEEVEMGGMQIVFHRCRSWRASINIIWN
jgi:hypothetical protein